MLFFKKNLQESLGYFKTIQHIDFFIGTGTVGDRMETGKQEIASYMDTYTNHKHTVTNSSH